MVLTMLAPHKFTESTGTYEEFMTIRDIALKENRQVPMFIPSNTHTHELSQRNGKIQAT